MKISIVAITLWISYFFDFPLRCFSTNRGHTRVPVRPSGSGIVGLQRPRNYTKSLHRKGVWLSSVDQDSDGGPLTDSTHFCQICDTKVGVGYLTKSKGRGTGGFLGISGMGDLESLHLNSLKKAGRTDRYPSRLRRNDVVDDKSHVTIKVPSPVLLG